MTHLMKARFRTLRRVLFEVGVERVHRLGAQEEAPTTGADAPLQGRASPTAATRSTGSCDARRSTALRRHSVRECDALEDGRLARPVLADEEGDSGFQLQPAFEELTDGGDVGGPGVGGSRSSRAVTWTTGGCCDRRTPSVCRIWSNGHSDDALTSHLPQPERRLPDPPALGRELRTERLVLRPATAADARATWEYRHLEAVNEWLTGAPADPEGYEAHFSDSERLSRTVILTLAPELGGDLVGDLMLRVEDAWAQLEVQEQARGTQAELGWVLRPSYAGQGYATEAVRELMRYVFEELGIRRIVANCFLDNEPSWRLMERVGMRRETPCAAGLAAPQRAMARQPRVRHPARGVGAVALAS